MTEQRTPDELTAENELICERLLEWTKNPSSVPGIGFSGWQSDDRSTPSFTTWAEAGLILDALTARRDHGWCLGDAEPARNVRCFSMGIHGYKFNAIRQTGPEAIRAAALYFIRNLP